MVGIIQMRMIETGQKIELEKFVERQNHMFKKGFLGWFDQISHKNLDGNTLQIYGLHSLGQKFSFFIEELLRELIISLFNFHLIKEKSEVRSNMINLYFTKQSG